MTTTTKKAAPTKASSTKAPAKAAATTKASAKVAAEKAPAKVAAKKAPAKAAAKASLDATVSTKQMAKPGRGADPTPRWGFSISHGSEVVFESLHFWKDEAAARKAGEAKVAG